jgi:hypothetical protein
MSLTGCGCTGVWDETFNFCQTGRHSIFVKLFLVGFLMGLCHLVLKPVSDFVCVRCTLIFDKLCRIVNFYVGNEYIFIDQRFSEYRPTNKELWISYVKKAIINLFMSHKHG